MELYVRVLCRLSSVLAILSLVNCSPSSPVMVEGQNSFVTTPELEVSEASEANAKCQTSQNLLIDVEFDDLIAGAWYYTQHAGERSFDISSQQGLLSITRVGKEPWMILKQRVELPETGPNLTRTIIMSSDLKGQVETEPLLHGFEHVAGLFLQPSKSPRSARLADHQPNQGVWDWQRFEVSVPVRPGSDQVQAGFIHQAGGSLWARNPSLVLMECAESG